MYRVGDEKWGRLRDLDKNSISRGHTLLHCTTCTAQTAIHSLHSIHCMHFSVLHGTACNPVHIAQPWFLCRHRQLKSSKVFSKRGAKFRIQLQALSAGPGFHHVRCSCATEEHLIGSSMIITSYKQTNCIGE